MLAGPQSHDDHSRNQHQGHDGGYDEKAGGRAASGDQPWRFPAGGRRHLDLPGGPDRFDHVSHHPRRWVAVPRVLCQGTSDDAVEHAGDGLQHDELGATVIAGIEDARRLGVVGQSGGARLAREVSRGFGLAAHRWTEHFDRDRLVVYQISGEIDVGGAAGLDESVEPVTLGEGAGQVHRDRSSYAPWVAVDPIDDGGAAVKAKGTSRATAGRAVRTPQRLRLKASPRTSWTECRPPTSSTYLARSVRYPLRERRRECDGLHPAHTRRSLGHPRPLFRSLRDGSVAPALHLSIWL